MRRFFENQLQDWKLASQNFESLKYLKKKSFTIGKFNGIIQFNPARAVSSLAKLDATSVAERKCFLCGHNRPPEQRACEILNGWELLVNPYPIFPYHFTIASKQHTPQKPDIEAGRKLARLLPEMVVFYNDSGAGASAPDHQHFQAVPTHELPLISYILQGKQNKLPFLIIEDTKEISSIKTPVNLYFFFKGGKDYFVAIPRISHRPSQFFLSPPERRAVSPGAIDMGGIIITPIEEDFERLTSEDIKDIYSQVAYPNQKKVNE